MKNIVPRRGNTTYTAYSLFRQSVATNSNRPPLFLLCILLVWLHSNIGNVCHPLHHCSVTSHTWPLLPCDFTPKASHPRLRLSHANFSGLSEDSSNWQILIQGSHGFGGSSIWTHDSADSQNSKICKSSEHRSETDRRRAGLCGQPGE